MDQKAKSKFNRDMATRLQKAWGVSAEHVLYRETGDWYNPLKRFPAALFDANGYVLFASEEE